MHVLGRRPPSVSCNICVQRTSRCNALTCTSYYYTNTLYTYSPVQKHINQAIQKMYIIQDAYHTGLSTYSDYIQTLLFLPLSPALCLPLSASLSSQHPARAGAYMYILHYMFKYIHTHTHTHWHIAMHILHYMYMYINSSRQP